MSIFSKLFHTRDKPQNYYTGTDMHYLFGRSSSDKQVNEFTAMRQRRCMPASASWRKPWQPCRCSSTATHRAARSGSMTIRCTICSMMNRTRR